MNFNLQFKDIFCKSFLFFTSTYIPLLIYSSVIILFSVKTNSVTQLRIKQEDIPQKISAIRSGYIPVFNPKNLIKDNEKLELYPIGSIPLKKSYYCNEGYGLIKYKTDQFGLRNSSDKWQKVLNQKNIFIIGDSFVHGACVPKNGTLSNLVQKSLKINTLNLGTGGNDPYEYIAILESIIKPIMKKNNKDQKVFLVLFSNDNITFNPRKEILLNKVQPIIKQSLDNLLVPTFKYKSFITKLVENNYPTDKNLIINRIKNKKKEDHRLIKDHPVYQIITIVPIRTKIKYFFKNFKGKDLNNSPSQKAIESLSKICINNCQPSVIYIRNRYQKNSNLIKNNYEEELKQISKKFKVKFYNTEKIVTENANYAPKGEHFSIKGYKNLANLIIGQINKNNNNEDAILKLNR